MYAKLFKLLENFFSKAFLFKNGFNYSPMYRRTTARVCEVSKDLLHVKIKIALSYKNRNYVGSIFGGSLSSATDPIYMIQLIQILGDDYVVWDKMATIKFKRPARDHAYANFDFSMNEINQIKKEVSLNNEIDWVKELNITNYDKSITYAEVSKTLYIARKSFYQKKHKR